MRKWRRDFVDVVHGGVFQRAGGIALSIVHDNAAGRVGRLGRDACQPKRDRVGQCHVAVVTETNTGVSGVSGSIKSLVGMAAGVHLVSSQSPLVTHSPLGVFLACSPMRRANSAALVASLSSHAVERKAAIDKVDVGVIEARQQQFSGCVDCAGVGAVPGLDIGVGADRHDPVAQHRNRLGGGMVFVHRPDFGVADDEIGSGLGLRGGKRQNE